MSDDRGLLGEGGHDGRLLIRAVQVGQGGSGRDVLIHLDPGAHSQ